MRRIVLPLIALVFPLLLAAHDKPQTWIQVRSPHVTVVCNSNDKQARRIADQFERMQSVFHTLFPKIQINTLGPITVLAIKDEKDFRALEPAAYLAKGQIHLGGLFLRAPDKNYVLLRLDAEGDHPYAVVYHEYTHLLMSKAESIPLWFNEGLAEFYENTDIREKDVALGQFSPESLFVLRQNRLLPLATLFTVDYSSPYYHEENKGSIFYAESWALMHYLQVKDYRNNTHSLMDYAQLVAQNVDPVTAATRAFGDPKQLQSALENYVAQATFSYFKMATVTNVDTAAFASQPLTGSQADAVRADFLAFNQRTADARALLDSILQADPNNVSAHETMGFLEFQAHHLEESRRWYEQAVSLDSQNYLAHYYFAAISMNGIIDASEEPKVESSLRASIKLNPNFAPSYDRLAVFLVLRHRNLDEARLMELSAVQLEPANLNYRLDTANVLLQMERGKDAVTVIQNAMHLASSPQDTAMAENFLLHAQEYAQQQEHNGQFNEQTESDGAAVNSMSQVEEAVPIREEAAPHDEPPPDGPHHFMTGVLKNVKCHAPAIDLNLIAEGNTLTLHASNYFKLEYTSLGVTLKKDLSPCADLEGRPAKVEYVAPSGKQPAVLIAVEIHK
jgi:tetratricopeptide (TPR) repeat protein